MFNQFSDYAFTTAKVNFHVWSLLTLLVNAHQMWTTYQSIMQMKGGTSWSHFLNYNTVPIFMNFFGFLALSANCVFWGVKQLLKDQQVEIIGMAFSSWFWTCFFFWLSSWSIHEKSITLVEFEVRSGFRTTVFEHKTSNKCISD